MSTTTSTPTPTPTPTPPRRSRRRPRPVRVAVVAISALAVVFGLQATAGADGRHGDGPIVDGLAGPLSIDVTGRGDVLVGQGFSGTVSSVSRRGVVTDLFQEEGASAVAAAAYGAVVYTVRTDDGTALVKLRTPDGRSKLIADLGAYEAKRNPDRRNVYGIAGISDECAADWPTDELGPPTYTGQVDSNPYAIALTWGGMYIADSGANAILFVGWNGKVRTTAVLAPQPTRIPDDATSVGLPACVGGLTYAFEPVPTDIELSRAGAFATLLPGGPEDPSLGARGSVVKVDLTSGRSRTVAHNLLAATDLAVSPSGTIYVTELFGAKVSKVTRSGTRTVAELNEPVAIEWAQGRLYVAYDAFGSGKIRTIRG